MTRVPFEILFYPNPLVAPGWQLRWVRFYTSLQAACSDAPDVVVREYPCAEVRAIRQITREAL